MDNAYIIVAVAVAIAVIVVFVAIAKRLKKNISPMAQTHQEPVFDDTEESASHHIGQGELRINKFKYPELPNPIDSNPVLEMCYIIRFYGSGTRGADEFINLQERFLPRYAPRELLLAYDEKSEEWRPPAHEDFSHWLLAVPLANRSGKISNEKIKSLEEEIRRFVENKTLHVTFSPVAESLKNADLLDKFCETADVIVELWLSAKNDDDETPDKKIKAEMVTDLARMNGLVTNNKGQYVLRDESEVLFLIRLMTVRGTDEVIRITFELDAPNVSNPVNAFDRMYSHLERIASVLQMEISDPRGEVMDRERLRLIRSQLMVLEQQMREFGVPPGGTIARLLFN